MDKKSKIKEKLMGMFLIVVGTVGIIASTIFEIRTKAKIYEIMMKIFPLCFAIGAIMWSFKIG